MAWLFLVIAGIFEVVWASCMKLSAGFSKLGFTALTVVGMIVSFWLLAKATRTLPMSVAYPVWTGIGAVGSVLVGAWVFGERLNLATWLFVGVLLIGIVGIKLSSR